MVKFRVGDRVNIIGECRVWFKKGTENLEISHVSEDNGNHRV